MCEICGFTECPAGCPNAELKDIGVCEVCGEPIYAGQKYIKPNGLYHIDCLSELTGAEICEVFDYSVMECSCDD